MLKIKKYFKYEYLCLLCKYMHVLLLQFFITNKLKYFIKNNYFNNCDIYFDNIFLGGIERYFKNILKNNKNFIVRIQNFKILWKLSIFYNNKKYEYWLTQKTIFKILNKSNNYKIYINGLIACYNIKEIMEYITVLKQNNNEIIMLIHDYFSVCPSFNLINDKGVYCYLPNIEKCNKCFMNNKFVLSKYKSYDIVMWRKLWNKFFVDVVDKIVVFSNSSFDIVSNIYPKIRNKIILKPHDLSFLKIFNNIKCDKNQNNTTCINIGVLGNISYQKGGKILESMIDILEQTKQKTNIKIIGKNNYNKNIYSTGKYELKDLPYILQKEKIDIIFIPSIWPETFSYTTSEAITLDYPVASFNLGAQAEKISNYSKGLIISKINANVALEEIIKFSIIH